MIKQLKYLIILFVAGTISCSRISNEKLSEQWWKHGSGYSVGDVLIFTTERPSKYECRVSGDTIYSKGDSAIAIITGTETKLDGHVNLYIRNPETHEVGTYHGKGKKPE